MNTLTADYCIADWQANGNLSIKARHHFGTHVGIIISKEDADKLAKFILCHPVYNQGECSNKVDYSRCVGEPE